MAAEAPGATDLPRTEPAEAAAAAVVEPKDAEPRDGAEAGQEPAKTVSLQEGSRVTTPFGGGTLKSIREDGTMVVTLDWSLANDAEARAYLQAASVTPRKVGEMTMRELIAHCVQLKGLGAQLFNGEAFPQALQVFGQEFTILQFALTRLDKEQEAIPDAPRLRAAVRTLLLDALNNIALCHIMLGNFRHAITAASTVLQQDPSDTVALARRARALLELREFEAADADIKKGLQLEPTDKLLGALALASRKLSQEQKKQELQRWGGFLNKGGKDKGGAQAVSASKPGAAARAGAGAGASAGPSAKSARAAAAGGAASQSEDEDATPVEEAKAKAARRPKARKQKRSKGQAGESGWGFALAVGAVGVAAVAAVLLSRATRR